MSTLNIFRTLRDRRWDPEKDDPKALWSRLNEAWRDLITQARAQQRGIYVVTQDFTGPAASLTFAIDVTTRPLGMVLVGLYETTTNATSAPTFSWTYDNGQVTTTAFSAIPAGSWQAAFLVIREGD